MSNDRRATINDRRTTNNDRRIKRLEPLTPQTHPQPQSQPQPQQLLILIKTLTSICIFKDAINNFRLLINIFIEAIP